MPFDIQNRGSYVLIKMTGQLDRDQVLQAALADRAVPEYRRVGTIWDLSEAQIKISYLEFPSLIDSVLSVYGPEITGGKVALVAQPGLMSGVVKLWNDEAWATPWHFADFIDLDEAEAWVTQRPIPSAQGHRSTGSKLPTG